MATFNFHDPGGEALFRRDLFSKDKKDGELLTQIASLWQKDRARLFHFAEEVIRAIQTRKAPLVDGPSMGPEILKKGYEQLARNFDPEWGGFGSAPKFPTPHNLRFLLRWHRRVGDSMALEMVEKTLDSMRRGGLFDQIGFGFHRYSVDEKWLVHHFEKMLYDQALLAMAYTDDYAFLVWGLIELYEAIFDVHYLEEAIVLNSDMMDLFRDRAEGGFYFTGADQDTLITRTKEVYDGATPSGNSVEALNILRLGRMTGNPDLEKRAEDLHEEPCH